MIKINMDKAKDIKRDQLRLERQPELERLDVEYQRALESNDQEKMAQIVEQKEKLRDAPASPQIQNAQSVESLNKITLDKLTQ
jgi:hypothetical protein